MMRASRSAASVAEPIAESSSQARTSVRIIGRAPACGGAFRARGALSYGLENRSARVAREARSAMTEDDLFALMDSILPPLGAESEAGDESPIPPLEILGYY